jgi:hypothetical protein
MPTIQVYSPLPQAKGGDVAEDKFSFLTTLAFSINFAMGAGFLTLPYAL